MGRRKRNTQNAVQPIHRKESIRIAEELGYDESVVEKIKKATTEIEIDRILSDARKGEE